MDHTGVLRSIILGLPIDWKRPRPTGLPRRNWLRTIEKDLRPLNIGYVSAWQRAQVVDGGSGQWTQLRSRMGYALDDDGTS